MNCYQMPEYLAFVRAMRAALAERTTPLVCADWLDEHGKHDHARFVRGCVRMRELRDILDECLMQDLHYTDPTRAEPDRELMQLIPQLRRLIRPNCHEWTGGAIRRFDNPTPYDWPHGFLQTWGVRPIEPGSDRRIHHHAMHRLEALLARQPIVHMKVELPAVLFPPPRHVLKLLAARFPGVKFSHNGVEVVVPEAVPA